jgi:hypothetical protein
MKIRLGGELESMNDASNSAILDGLNDVAFVYKHLKLLMCLVELVEHDCFMCLRILLLILLIIFEIFASNFFELLLLLLSCDCGSRCRVPFAIDACDSATTDGPAKGLVFFCTREFFFI